MTKLHYSFIFTSSLIFATGCSHTHRGGISEWVDPTMITVEADRKIRPEHGIRFDYGVLKNHLDLLILRGANYCFPASVHKAQLREYRILREMDGELFYDAANDVVAQRIHLARLERQLEYVLKDEECVWPDDQQRTLVEQLKELLNSDNIFAYDDFQINPKYAENLRDAASILVNSRHIIVKIYGHADSHGSDSYNSNLSWHRAEKVRDFLIKEGVNESQLSVLALSNRRPLYNGEEAHVRLVNRRVLIEVESNL